jgi:pilus assembly protein Flp/PilA
MLGILRRLLRDEEGATAIEYSLLAALVGLGMVSGVDAFGTQVVAYYSYVTGGVDTAVGVAESVGN